MVNLFLVHNYKYIYTSTTALIFCTILSSRSKFNSDVNKEVLAVLLKEVHLANPQFQACQIRGQSDILFVAEDSIYLRSIA